MHHALCAVVEPIFERGFIHDSYANRKGKGTHRAIARYERSPERFRDVLRRNIRPCFPSIDHGILKRDLRQRGATPPALALTETPRRSCGPRGGVSRRFWQAAAPGGGQCAPPPPLASRIGDDE